MNADCAALVNEALADLTTAAVAAPSADNRHMFHLGADGSRLHLRAAPGLQEAHPRRQRLALLSLGAVVENITLRGARLGLHLQPEWPQAFFHQGRLVDFVVSAQEPVSSMLEEAIERRHSNRRLRFRGPPLPKHAREAFGEEGADPEGVRIVWFDGGAERRRLAKALLIAEAARFACRELHEEIYESVRLDLAAGATASEGIPLAALELSLLERSLFATLRHWRFQQAANLTGAHWISALRSVALPTLLAPHAGVVLGQRSDPQAAVEAGRLLQRVWLRATAQGLALQVFAALPLFLLPGLAPLGMRQRQSLEAEAAAALPAGTPHLVFRLGYADPPTVVATRPPSRDFLSSAP